MKGTAQIFDLVSYSGTLEVIYPANRKGSEGQCFAKIPGTQLTTKNFGSIHELRDSFAKGAVEVK